MARSANAYVKINVLADTKQARSQLGGMAGSLQQWANGFQKAGRIATLATAAIAAGLYAFGMTAKVIQKGHETVEGKLAARRERKLAEQANTTPALPAAATPAVTVDPEVIARQTKQSDMVRGFLGRH